MDTRPTLRVGGLFYVMIKTSLYRRIIVVHRVHFEYLSEGSQLQTITVVYTSVFK